CCSVTGVLRELCREQLTHEKVANPHYTSEFIRARHRKPEIDKCLRDAGLRPSLTPGERVYLRGTVGSNPTPSASNDGAFRDGEASSPFFFGAGLREFYGSRSETPSLCGVGGVVSHSTPLSRAPMVSAARDWLRPMTRV